VQGQLEQAQLNIDNTIIRSPATGIGNRRIEVGQNVKVGQQLIDIVSLGCLDNSQFQAEPARPPKAGTTGQNQSGWVVGITQSQGEMAAAKCPCQLHGRVPVLWSPGR